jgi:hypothetical protein
VSLVVRKPGSGQIKRCARIYLAARHMRAADAERYAAGSLAEVDADTGKNADRAAEAEPHGAIVCAFPVLEMTLRNR